VTTAEGRRYRFAPLERRGVIAGVRAGQLVAATTGLVAGVAALRAARSPLLGAVLAAALAAGGAAVAWLPVKGRTTEEWAPVGWSWARARLAGRHRHVDRACLVGSPPPGPGGGTTDASAGRGPLAGCEVLVPPVGLGGRRMAIVQDRQCGTFVGVLAVRASGFALVGGEEQRRRLDAWAAVLSGLAREGTRVHRAQWVLRVVPGDADDLLRHLEAAGSPGAPADATASYRELVEGAGPAARRHEAFLALAVHRRRVRSRGEASGAPEVVARELRALEAALAPTDIESEGPLGAGALRRLLREMADPALARAGTRGRGQVGALGGVPMAGDGGWSMYRCDGGYHASYWIAEWPRVDVGPEFLTPLLLGAQHRRTVSLVLEPVPARRAAREAEAARTAHMADDELRRRGGFITSARRRREQEEVLIRETELADGHALYRYSGYATASARSSEELAAACSELEVAAARAHLDLRRLYGQQAEAFSWTLPLARGLA